MVLELEIFRNDQDGVEVSSSSTFFWREGEQSQDKTEQGSGKETIEETEKTRYTQT
jgi:hypothetical protein